MRRVLLAAATLGMMLVAIFTPAATAHHNTTVQVQESCGGSTGGHCVGDADNERWVGDAAPNSINAAQGDDDIIADDDNDFLYGSAGKDDLWGGPGSDRLYGGNQADELYGGLGADHIYTGCSYGCSESGEGRDSLFGNEGNDVLHANNNKSDNLSCGEGTDRAYADPSGTGYGDSVGASCETVIYG